MSNAVVAVDFDGTLHPYTDGWTGSVPFDEPPTDGALDFLLMLKARGYDIVVFSARANHAEGHDGIMAWLRRYGLLDCVERVTHVKPMAMAYVDDRAVRYAGDWVDCLEQIETLHQDMKVHGAQRLAEL